MGDFYCPAVKCFCRSVNWEANCNGVTIGNARDCIRPTKKQLLTPKEIADEHNVVGAEYLAGALAQSKADRVAVEKINYKPLPFDEQKRRALAALDEAAPK
jgi:hypothetical protein